MNILIIGNGFDIAHNLPTRYKEFLEFCSLTKRATVIWNNNMSEVTVSGLKRVKQEKYERFCTTMGYSLWGSFQDLVKNFWIGYFQDRCRTSGENWIDFEEEMRLLIESLYQAIPGSINDKVDVTVINAGILRDYCKTHNYHGKRTYKALFEDLLKANKNLIRCLELYMDGYINRIDVNKIPYISNKEFDKVLSFNYTVTYTEHYNPRADCCYIHGRADVRRNIDGCNLVLGYDDHYVEGTKAIPELIPFEKYYQRIVNRNDKQYFDWLDEINNSEAESTVYIYGHSLGTTDGDVLRKFILNEHVKVKIFYYNEADRAEKIKNLAVVLEPDNLIKLTGGSNPVIEFETV